MLPRTDLSANRPPTAVETTRSAHSATDVRAESSRRLDQIAIGREISATVQSKLNDGTHLVQLGQAHARMALPLGTQVGDQLKMILIAREPRPTFLLNGQGASASTSISTAARLIDQLIQSTQSDASTPTLKGATPLLGRFGLDPQQLATQLRQALSGSGLFYESHLQQWVAGSRSLADLAREPQARMRAQQDSQTALSPQDMTRLASGLRELGDHAQAILRMIRDAQKQNGNPLNVDADILTRDQAKLPTLDPELARMIQMQLDALEHQHVRWQGELRPGQVCEWEVAEEPSEGDPENHAASSWSSTMRFELPHLGMIEAKVRLIGQHVDVRIVAPDDVSAETLKQHTALLDDALAAAGLPLDAVLVQTEFNTPTSGGPSDDAP